MPFKKSRLVLAYSDYKALCVSVHQRDGWKCRSCKTRNNLHAHHIIFRSQRGDDADYNLITLCHICHKAVHARNLLILAITGNVYDPVDANKALKFFRVNGWTPQ